MPGTAASTGCQRDSRCGICAHSAAGGDAHLAYFFVAEGEQLVAEMLGIVGVDKTMPLRSDPRGCHCRIADAGEPEAGTRGQQHEIGPFVQGISLNAEHRMARAGVGDLA